MAIRKNIDEQKGIVKIIVRKQLRQQLVKEFGQDAMKFVTDAKIDGNSFWDFDAKFGALRSRIAILEVENEILQAWM
jgi:hypothetical protein